MKKRIKKILITSFLLMVILSYSVLALAHWDGNNDQVRFSVYSLNTTGSPLTGVREDRPGYLNENAKYIGLEEELEKADIPNTNFAVLFEDEFSYIWSMDNNMAQANKTTFVPTYGSNEETGNKYPLVKTRNESTSPAFVVTHIELRKLKPAIQYIRDCVEEKEIWRAQDETLYNLCNDMLEDLDWDISVENEIDVEADEEAILCDGYWVASAGTLNNRTWVSDGNYSDEQDPLPLLLTQGRGQRSRGRYPYYKIVDKIIDFCGIGFSGTNYIVNGSPRELDDDETKEFIKMLRGDSSTGVDDVTYAHMPYTYYLFYGVKTGNSMQMLNKLLCGTNTSANGNVAVYCSSDNLGHYILNQDETFWYVADNDEVKPERLDYTKDFRTLHFESDMGGSPAKLSIHHDFCDHAQRGCGSCETRGSGENKEEYCPHGERDCTDCQHCIQTCPTILRDSVYAYFNLKQSDDGPLMASTRDLGGNFTQQFVKNPAKYLDENGNLINTTAFPGSGWDNPLKRWQGVTGYASYLLPKNAESPEADSNTFVMNNPGGYSGIGHYWSRYGGELKDDGNFNLYNMVFKDKVGDIEGQQTVTSDASKCPNVVFNQFFAFSKGGENSTMNDLPAANLTGSSIKNYAWKTGNAYRAMNLGADPWRSFNSHPELPDDGDIIYDPNVKHGVGHLQWDFDVPDYWLYSYVKNGTEARNEASNGLILPVITATQAKSRVCNTIVPKSAWCPHENQHMCTEMHKLTGPNPKELERIQDLYKFTLIMLYPPTTVSTFGESYEIEDQEMLEAEDFHEFHDGNVLLPDQDAEHNAVLASTNIYYTPSDSSAFGGYDSAFYNKRRIRTATLNPITVWKSAVNDDKKVYGIQDLERAVGSRTSDKMTNYTKKNSITLNVWEKTNGGSIIWPYVQTKMLTPQDVVNKTWYSNFYAHTGPSQITQAVQCTYGVAYGNDTNTSVSTAANRVGKPAISIESNWDAHSSTLTGLDKTGILEANGGDKDCVVHGGSTVFLKTADTSTDADKITILFNGYIPIYYRNTGNAEWQIQRDAPIDDLGFRYDRDVSPFDFSNNASQNYPFDVTVVADAIKNLARNIEANLSNIKLELYVAPGIYRQGEEADFMKNAKCVSGPDRNDTFNGRALHQDKKYFLSEAGSTVSEEQSSSVRVKLLTDNDGLDGVTYYKALIDLGTDPGKKSNAVKLKLSHTDYFDPDAMSGNRLNPAVLYNPDLRSGDGKDDDIYLSEGAYRADDGWLDVKKIKTKGRDTSWNEINSKLSSSLKDRWKQLNEQTGFLTNLIYALDFNTGGGKHLDVKDVSGGESLSHTGIGHGGLATGDVGDWFCPYCDVFNVGGDINCRECGKENPNTPKWTCSACSYANLFRDPTCANCGKARDRENIREGEEIDMSAGDILGSYPGLRPEEYAINGKTTGNEAGWFNEAINDIGIVEFQLEYEVDFSALNGTPVNKWLCINPALTGNQTNTYDQRNWIDNNNDGREDSDLKSKGAMKDKIRTARFITTTYCNWEDIEDALDEDLLGVSGFKYDLYRRLNESLYDVNNPKNKNFVGSLFICDDTAISITNEDSDSDIIIAENKPMQNMKLLDYEEYGEPYHYCNLPIYADFDNLLSSKFFYIDNVVS